MSGIEVGPASPSDVPRPPLTILLVDDNDLLRNLVRRILEHHGFLVLEARTPIEALVLLTAGETPVDALVADLAPPGMTGPELSDEIARIGRPIPALYYSAFTRYPGRSLGPREAFLRKPFGMNEFMTKLSALLGVGDAKPPVPTPIARSNHIVKIYLDAEGLAKTVAPYLAEGLRAGEQVTAIVTRPHWPAIARLMEERGSDPAAAQARGQLGVIDAQDTLKRLHPGKQLDRKVFDSFLAEVMEPLNAAQGQVRGRLYGEMVDLLWRCGRLDAALALEGLWNGFLDPARYQVLCGYQQSLMDSGDDSAFVKVSECHSHVLLA